MIDLARTGATLDRTNSDYPYATPRKVERIEDCDFYHVIDLPGQPQIQAQWDLRPGVNAYLGDYDLTGKRVLEIGPASGFLTFEMEKRGAEVVALEVPDDPGWDFVPYPAERLTTILAARRRHMTRIKNSFWYCHRVMGSRAKLCYGDCYNISPELGHFDVAIMAAMLLHTQNPVRIMAECAGRSNTLIVVERLTPELEGRALCQLDPTAENFYFDTWWKFSTDFFRQYFSVLGFPYHRVTTHTQLFEGKQTAPLFTAIGSREPL